MNEIDQIKKILSIDEVISSYIKLEKAGSNLKARCPFHNEKTPSFFVSPEKRFYKCFGCGATGDIFSFVQKYEGIDFSTALEKLAQKAGVVLDKKSFKKKEDNSVLYRILEDITLFWQKKLLKNEEVKDYLKKRGLVGETVKKFRLGYASDSWSESFDFLKSRGYKEEEIEEVGLIKKKENGGYYDRFRNRVIFPIFDLDGRVIAFSGRDLSGSYKVAKYLNSPETKLFNKSKILYGLNFARNEAMKMKYFIIGEGQMDLLMSHQAGFSNTVVTSGTSLTDEHLKILKRYSDKIIFAFDSDNAGVSASYRGIMKALKNNFDVKIVDLEDGKDPADTILESEKKWKNKIFNAKNWLDFFIEKIIFKDIAEKDKINELEEKILPFVKIIPDPILKGKYVSKIADGFGVKDDFILESLKKVEAIRIETELDNLEKEKANENIDEKLDNFSKKGIISVKKLILRELFAIYFWQSEIDENKRWIENLDEFLSKIQNKISDNENKDFLNLSNFLKDQLILEVQVKYEGSTKENLNFSINNLFERLEKIFIDEKILDLKEKITFLGNSKEKEELIKELQNLIKQKH